MMTQGHPARFFSAAIEATLRPKAINKKISHIVGLS